jgi:predicted RNase H-like nuclease
MEGSKSLVDYYIEIYPTLSIVATFSISIIIFLIKACRGKWKREVFNLADIVSLILYCYSLPTASLLILCCSDISKLESVSGISVYIVISGIALIYVAGTSIYNYLTKDRD